ncbi:hypothetical protein MnBA_39470 [Marinobacterium sp. BA1]
MTVRLSEEEFTIEIQDNQALLKKGTDIVLEKAFIPWGPADDDYVAMIGSFGDKGVVDEDWFQRATSAFHDRF